MRLPRRTSPYVVDGALAALVLFAVSLQFLFPDEDGDPLSWQGFLLGAGTAVPLIWRRRAPLLCAVVVTVATPAMALYHAPPPDVVYGGLVLLYTLAAYAEPVPRRVMLVGWLIGASATMSMKEHAEPFEYAFHLLSLLSAYGFGVLARTQRAYTTALEERARAVEREREVDRARAVTSERARIARDMHDVVGHAVSLMVVQAEAGPVVVRSDPARAEAAFDAIAGAGREAMQQLRLILGVLTDHGNGARGVGDPAVAPTPGVARLPDLIGQVSATTEVAVTLRSTGHPRPLAPETETAAYRIVQEALTNTVKHAYAARADVQLDWGEAELAITVTDDGTGPDTPGAGGGRGLVGIEERAAACGGSAHSGPGPHGGFRVTARLPAAHRPAAEHAP
ncbi:MULTISPECIES: sensor histidine kinase [unclassified Streptomyces]|uniref:sensor histidine kinase n=1 Tax=unclassified Streptomyces TaxID=2593676 RepID=UPI002E178306